MAGVLKVEKDICRPPQKPKLTGPRSTRKHARDSDLSTFVPISKEVAQVKDKHEKDQYDFYMKHRCHPAKILDVQILKEDGLKLFNLIVKREGRAEEENEQVLVHKFGYSEHKEMITVLKGKPKSHLTGTWMLKIQQKMKAKVEMEERLFGKISSPKRKATDAPSGSRPTKK